MSLIAAMNISRGALNVNQMALNVVSNNVANMNTEGYLKQRVNQVELLGYTPYTSSKGIQIYTGGGVGISSISQYTNQQLLNYINGQNGEFEKLNNMLSAADDLADIMNELGDTGLSSAFTNFYSAAQQLTQNPSDSVLRINYVNAAQQVAEKFNQISKSINAKRTELVGDINNPQSVSASEAALTVESINTKLNQLAELNKSIISTSASGGISNNMLNERNALLSELSSLVDFTITENSNGSVNLQIGGVDVVSGGELVAELNVVAGDIDNPAKVQIQTTDEPPKVKISNLSDKLQGGSLKGILDAGSNTVDGLTFQKVLDQVNLLAKSFAEQVNEIQMFNDGNTAAMAIGLDAEGNKILVPSTEPLFVISDGGGEFDASNIKINQAVFDNPNLVAAARVEIDANGDPLDNKAVGNTNNLTEIIALQNKNFDGLGGVTLSGFLKNLVTKVGLQASELETKVLAQADVVDQANSKYLSEGSVDLNEELMDMIKYQRAFEASSRIFSTCNEMMQVLVNLGA